jgi:ABC-type uncharacterized transport system involved in gliding motility auxiliary subunit
MAAKSKPHRIATFAQAAVYTLIVIGILAVLNFLANRYDKSFDSTANKRYTLSDQSMKIARELKQPVTISYWDSPDSFTNAQGLFDRYKNLSPKIDVRYQDVDKKRTEAIAQGVKNRGAIIVEVGNKREEAKSLTEEEVTGAMVRALKGGDRTVCFTSGFGEGAIDNTEKDGYSAVKDLTSKNNYKTEAVPLIPKPEIPMDCTILVVGGPKRDYIQPAVDAIKAYAENGGRELIMVDPPLKFGSEVDDNAALVDVLAGWGVKMQKDLVLDLSPVGQLFGTGPELPIVTMYTDHAIVKTMKDRASGFPITRSLEVSNGDKTMVSALFSSSEDSIATTNLASPNVNTKEAKPGARILAAAGQFTTATDKGKGQFVVVGTSRWISNGFLGFDGNRDLYMNMLNWLSSDEDLISIRPKDPEDRRVNMNSRQVSMMFYTSVIGFPLLIVLAGVGMWWKRR